MLLKPQALLYAIEHTFNISFLHAVNPRTNAPAYCIKIIKKQPIGEFLSYSQIIASAAAPLPLVSRLWSVAESFLGRASLARNSSLISHRHRHVKVWEKSSSFTMRGFSSRSE
jgi:hypothetical protein